MKKRMSFSRRILCVLLTAAILLTLASCGKKTDSFEVISSIDGSSVTEEDGITTFTATDKNGRSIRFQGRGVFVTDDGLVMEQGATLLSLDYIGQIYDMTIEADLEDAKDYMFEYGIGYADEASVESANDLSIAMPWGGTPGYPMDVSHSNTGFVVLYAHVNNPLPITVKKLTINYDAGVEQQFLSDLDPASEEAEYLAFYLEMIPDDNVFEYGDDRSKEQRIFDEKLEDPNTIMSDIIAGIDHSSISKDGDTTFFSSVMSDGAVVRFEGYHIDISEEGITIHPDSKITSLDALGKIYGYYPTVVDYESYPLYEAYLDYGYGYTYSASKTSVDHAYEVHTWGISGLGTGECSGEIAMPAVAHQPNFVYITGNILNNKHSFVVSSLEAYYDPTEKVTAMREARMEDDFTSYIEGELYDSSVEETEDPYAVDEDNLVYYLVVAPDTELAQMENSGGSIWYVPDAFFEVGETRALCISRGTGADG